MHSQALKLVRRFQGNCLQDSRCRHGPNFSHLRPSLYVRLLPISAYRHLKTSRRSMVLHPPRWEAGPTGGPRHTTSAGRVAQVPRKNRLQRCIESRTAPPTEYNDERCCAHGVVTLRLSVSMDLLLLGTASPHLEDGGWLTPRFTLCL
jgi:hypothetical protein